MGIDLEWEQENDKMGPMEAARKVRIISSEEAKETPPTALHSPGQE